MDVYETLACLEMIQDYINCKAARLKALGSLGFSDNIMGKGNAILKVLILVLAAIFIFLENSRIEGVDRIEWVQILLLRGAVIYLLLSVFCYIPLSGLLFLFCEKRQKQYRESESFLVAKKSFKIELEKIAKNVTFLLQQLENSKVPEYYRNYSSLLFFSEVMENNKAGDLNEAIKLYEQFLNENELYSQFLDEKEVFQAEVAHIYTSIEDIDFLGYQPKSISKFLGKLF